MPRNRIVKRESVVDWLKYFLADQNYDGVLWLRLEYGPGTPVPYVARLLTWLRTRSGRLIRHRRADYDHHCFGRIGRPAWYPLNSARTVRRPSLQRTQLAASKHSAY